MKGKLKFTKMFVVMIMILSLCLSNAYAVSNEDQSIYLDDNTICSGKIIPAEVSNAVFSDAIDYDSLADVQFEREISITGDYVSVNLSLWIDSSEVQLQYAGEMYKSSRYTGFGPIHFQNPFDMDSDEPIIEILGISLYLDDIIILGLLFFLYQEGVKDYMLYLALIMLLLS